VRGGSHGESFLSQSGPEADPGSEPVNHGWESEGPAERNSDARQKMSVFQKKSSRISGFELATEEGNDGRKNCMAPTRSPKREKFNCKKEWRLP